MIVLVGASASGKTEVTKVLAKKYDFKVTNHMSALDENEQNKIRESISLKAKKKEHIQHNKNKDNFIPCPTPCDKCTKSHLLYCVIFVFTSCKKAAYSV